MPRTRIQQDMHNERRRQIKKEGRKAIFCMNYIQLRYPEIHNQVCEFFTAVNEKYPGKRDLSKTHEFKCLKESPGLMKNTMPVELEPHLEITLMPNTNTNATVSTPTTIETTIEEEEEIPPFIDMESEAIDRVIKELRQDPDLASAFDDIELQSTTVSAYTTIETTIEEEEIPPFIDMESEAIDRVIKELRQDPDLASAFDDIELQLEFDQLGEDLDIPELEQEIRW